MKACYSFTVKKHFLLEASEKKPEGFSPKSNQKISPLTSTVSLRAAENWDPTHHSLYLREAQERKESGALFKRRRTTSLRCAS